MKDAPGSLHVGQNPSRGHALPSPGGTGAEGGPTCTWHPGDRARSPVADGPTGAGRQNPDGQPTGPSTMPASRRDRSSTYERYHHQNPQGRGVPGDHRHRYSSIDGDKRHREVRGHRRPGTSEGRGQPAAPPAGAADPACAAVDLARRAVRGPVARFLRRGRVPAPPPHPPTPGPARDRHDRERTRWVSPRCPPTTPSTCGDSSVPTATCSPTISVDEPTPSCSAA